MVVEDSKILNVLNEFCDLIPKQTTLPALPARYLKVQLQDDDDDAINNDSTIKNHHLQSSMHLPFGITKVHQLQIKDTKELVPEIYEDSKRVIELILDASNFPVEYLPGDTIGILPENDPVDIEIVLNSTKLMDKADYQCKISLYPQNNKKTLRIPLHIPVLSTPRMILKQCLNLYSIPKKAFLRSLIEYTVNENEKKLLEILCSKEGTEIYTKMIANGQLNFISLLKICPSCQPDFEIILEHLPRLLPRPYSIANSPIESNGKMKIIFSILKSKTGVTTNYLQKFVNEFTENSFSRDMCINCYLREPSNFRYTEEHFYKNVIFISVGCGISPFLGFLEHRSKVRKQTNQNFGKLWLITGYRYRHCALYNDQIKEYLYKGLISEHFESFSRESDSEFKYIHDHFVRNPNKFTDMIFKENSLIYICADGAEISKDIQETIRKTIEISLQCTLEESKIMFDQLKKDGRYREDIWL